MIVLPFAMTPCDGEIRPNDLFALDALLMPVSAGCSHFLIYKICSYL